MTDNKTVELKCPHCNSPMRKKTGSDIFVCRKYPTKHKGTETEVINLQKKGRNIHQLVNILEYSKLTGIDRRKVYRLIEAGKLTLYKGLKHEPLLDPEEKPKDDTV